MYKNLMNKNLSLHLREVTRNKHLFDTPFIPVLKGLMQRVSFKNAWNIGIIDGFVLQGTLDYVKCIHHDRHHMLATE